MKCIEIGIIQAYIDGELDIELKKSVEAHLITCTKCNEAYITLKANDDFTFDKVNSYKQYLTENIKPAQKPFKQVIVPTFTERRPKNFMIKYKKLITAACLVLAAVTCISVQPIRASISSALSIFRIENIKALKISLADVEKIKTELREKNPNISLEQFGKISTTGGEQSTISLTAAKSLQDFTVKFPTAFSDSIPYIKVIAPSSINFTLNVKNVNDVLKSFGATDLFPIAADSKTFSVGFSKALFLRYKKGESIYTITQTATPQLSVPEGVNVDDLYNSVISLPVLPDDLKTKLKAITDWKSTIYLPVVDTQMEEITINGKAAYVYSKVNPKTGETDSWLIFSENRFVYGIKSNTSKEDIISVAQSMR